MHLPPAISRVLEQHSVPPETVVRFQDVFLSLGSAAVAAMAELCEDLGLQPSALSPDDLGGIRPRMGAKFLQEHHASWLAGQPSPAFWKERSLVGRIGGTILPLGSLSRAEARGEVPDGRLAMQDVRLRAEAILGEGQRVDRGLLLLSRHSHSSGREGSFSIDLVPDDMEDALALNESEGRQHTVPGSAGETSGTTFGEEGLAVIWEIQPSLYKPGKDRNRGAGKASRRYRNWHVLTLLCALKWLENNDYRILVLRGPALKPAHECDPNDELGDGVAGLHERTLRSVTSALGLSLVEPTADLDCARVAHSVSSALGRLVEEKGPAEFLSEVRKKSAPTS